MQSILFPFKSVRFSDISPEDFTLLGYYDGLRTEYKELNELKQNLTLLVETIEDAANLLSDHVDTYEVSVNYDS